VSYRFQFDSYQNNSRNLQQQMGMIDMDIGKTLGAFACALAVG